MKNDMKQEIKVIRWAGVLLFISIAFVVTAVFLIFFWSIDFPKELVRQSAAKTFAAVIAITVVFLFIFIISRYFTVIRPLRKINHTLDRIASGDFSERLSEEDTYGNFAGIINNINRMADELESSAIMKTDFISNVSHELKTPLAVMRNYSVLLESETVSDEERMEYAKGITSASEKMNELITNILRLNRLENSRLSPQKQKFDLSAQLVECLLQYENVWEEKQIDLHTEIEDDVFVTSDSDLLQLIWNNLLSNAFKFTEPGGRIDVSLTAEKNTAEVKVSDTGCGMTPDIGKHIFDKFYQGDPSHATEGNGLGLALVKRVIDLTDGEISVASTPKKGSTFTVRIRRDP